MIEAKVIQNEHGLMRAEYQYIENNDIQGNAYINQNEPGATIYFELYNRKYYIKYDKKTGSRYFNIYTDDGCHMGHFERKHEKGHWFTGGFHYTVAYMNDKCYHIYAVGKGKDGIHYPFRYQAPDGTQEQVALMCKDPVVYDLKDTYDCYMKNEDDRLLMFLFTVYNDFWAFGNAGSVAVNSKETRYVYTSNKKLKALCDPDFLKND